MEKVKQATEVKARQAAAVRTPSGLSPEATREISGSLNALLADFYALYFKTKNFHWHMSGPHFRDYHLLLDEQADQIFEVTDDIAERVRKIGGNTLHSVGEIKSHTRILDNDAEYVTPEDMLAELKGDNSDLVGRMREAHELTSEHNAVASPSLPKPWIDEAERRVCFLFEAPRRA